MSTRSWLSRLRAAAIYLAAWSPLVLVYVVEIESQEPISMADAVAAAVRSVAVAALLGLGVMAFATRIAWPERMNLRFALAHGAASVLYGFAWTGGMMLLLLRAFGSWQEVVMRAGQWWGWQTIFGMLLYWVIAGVTWTRVNGARARDTDDASAPMTSERSMDERNRGRNHRPSFT